jgi:hypothetical protein
MARKHSYGRYRTELLLTKIRKTLCYRYRKLHTIRLKTNLVLEYHNYFNFMKDKFYVNSFRQLCACVSQQMLFGQLI